MIVIGVGLSQIIRIGHVVATFVSVLEVVQFKNHRHQGIAPMFDRLMHPGRDQVGCVEAQAKRHEEGNPVTHGLRLPSGLNSPQSPVKFQKEVTRPRPRRDSIRLGGVNKGAGWRPSAPYLPVKLLAR